MNFRWYIGTLVIILTFLGVSQQSAFKANQEIVLQFQDSELAQEDTETTVAIIKKELQAVGVNDFKVKENNKGTLKITYYSDADVAVIKRLLTKRIRAELNASSDDDEDSDNLPFHQEPVTYNLDVYELQSGNDTESGLEGTFVLEMKAKADRFSKPKHNTSKHTAILALANANADLKVKIFKGVLLSIQESLYHIPEVRAGPIS